MLRPGRRYLRPERQSDKKRLDPSSRAEGDPGRKRQDPAPVRNQCSDNRVRDRVVEPSPNGAAQGESETEEKRILSLKGT